ncbi:MAG: lysophospholipid acyltransferase family protein [Bacteroidetes bacterium]|nr:lysophospholipid acyltransferase family protein [Bacteroidota bacterium]
MRYILIPFRVIFKIYYLIVFVLSLIVWYPIMYYFLYNPKRFPTAFKVMKLQALSLLILAGARLRIRGAENIPQTGAYIICPNHTSFLDIFCIYCVFPNYFVFTGKKEIEKWPLFNIYYTSGMNILVDRHSNTGSIKALKRMSREIDDGKPLVIFPEGTISKNAPELVSFKSGAFAIAIQKQIPILPVTFVTNWKRLNRGNFWFGGGSPGIAEVVIHPPVFTKGMNKLQVDHLQDAVQTIIASPLSVYKK